MLAPNPTAPSTSTALDRSTGAVRAPRLDSLTALRFFAALFVVVHHVTRVYDPVPVVSDLFELGGVGVSFFFVLSGFVLTWSHRHGQAPLRFYRHRFARIYPLHLLTLVVAGAILLWQGHPPALGIVAASVLLVQAWIPTAGALQGVNGPSWSLSSEAFFYAAFPLVRPLVVRLRVRPLLLVATTALVVAAAVAIGLRFAVGGDTVNYFLYMDPAYRFWEFLLGMVAATLLQRSRLRLPSLRAVVGAVLVAYCAIAAVDAALVHRWSAFARIPFQSLPSDLAALVLTPLFAVLVMAAARSDLDARPSRLRSPVLVRLGTWSFALYLTHLVLISALQPLVPQHAAAPLAVLIAIATIGVAVLLSGAVYQWIERPAERLLRHGLLGPAR